MYHYLLCLLVISSLKQTSLPTICSLFKIDIKFISSLMPTCFPGYFYPPVQLFLYYAQHWADTQEGRPLRIALNIHITKKARKTLAMERCHYCLIRSQQKLKCHFIVLCLYIQASEPLSFIPNHCVVKLKYLTIYVNIYININYMFERDSSCIDKI